MKILNLKKHILHIIYNISPEICLKLNFFKQRGFWPNFKHPKNLSEIILSKMLSGEICNYAPYVDKIAMRKFVEEWGLGRYLPKLYGTWNSERDIEFEKLPLSFALKTNHGCGSHYICSDKRNLDIKTARLTIRNALKTRYGTIEKQYNCIEPICFAEEYIADQRGGGQPLDYKFMCCDGEVRCILICSERDKGSRLATYDLNWNRLEYIRKAHRSTVEFEKPRNFDEMLEIANIIASKFECVRVDLYSLPNGKIYIGELTFTPAGGILSKWTNEAINNLGHLN